MAPSVINKAANCGSAAWIFCVAVRNGGRFLVIPCPLEIEVILEPRSALKASGPLDAK